MKTILTLLLLCPFILCAQYTKDSTTIERFEVLEQPAEFPGGLAAFYKYVASVMRYPSEARIKGVEGKVYVQFVIDEDGMIEPESVQVVKSDNELLNEESIRVIKNSPQWEPGRITVGGETTRQRMVMPIVFKLAGKPAKRKRN